MIIQLQNALFILVAIFMYGHCLHEDFRPCQKVALDEEVVMNITTKILKIIPWTKIRDGFPFLFVHPKTNMSAILCLPEKVASTTWKSLFIKTLEYNLFETQIRKGVDPHFVRFNETKNVLNPRSARIIANAILDPNIPRIMFTRDPYSRALSGYADKVADTTESPFDFHPGLGKSASFFEFTQYLFDHSPLNEHFQRLTDRCMLPMGMRYDYYLKIETMPQWYEPLIDMLDLRDEASWGWDYTSYWRPAINGETPDKCFYTPPGKTCKDMFNYPAPESKAIHTVQRRMNEQKEKVIHVKNSGTKLKQYYNETSVKRITTYAKCDLLAFGYPEWDGTNAESYIRSVHKLPVTTNTDQKFGCYVDNC